MIVMLLVSRLLRLTRLAEGFPRFTIANRDVVGLNSSFANPPPTHEIMFPTLVHAADHFVRPLGAYYLYFSPHESPGGIYLAYADALEGPWVAYERNPVVGRLW